jgi:hypothetical protein
VLDANPLGGVGLAFGLVRGGEGGTGSCFFRRADRGFRATENIPASLSTRRSRITASVW